MTRPCHHQMKPGAARCSNPSACPWAIHYAADLVRRLVDARAEPVTATPEELVALDNEALAFVEETVPWRRSTRGVTERAPETMGVGPVA